MNGKSLDTKEDVIKKLRIIAPQVFNEDKIDWEKLRSTFGDEINFADERYVLNWAGKSDKKLFSDYFQNYTDQTSEHYMYHLKGSDLPPNVKILLSTVNRFFTEFILSGTNVFRMTRLLMNENFHIRS